MVTPVHTITPTHTHTHTHTRARAHARTQERFVLDGHAWWRGRKNEEAALTIWMCIEKIGWKKIAQYRLNLISPCVGLKANALHKVIWQGENTKRVPILAWDDHLHKNLIRMLVFLVQRNLSVLARLSSEIYPTISTKHPLLICHDAICVTGIQLESGSREEKGRFRDVQRCVATGDRTRVSGVSHPRHNRWTTAVQYHRPAPQGFWRVSGFQLQYGDAPSQQQCGSTPNPFKWAVAIVKGTALF